MSALGVLQTCDGSALRSRLQGTNLGKHVSRSSSIALTARTMRMPRLWKYWQLSNCHRHALRKWLLVLKRANLAGLPHRRYACVMRSLRYSINVTLDGCCDHRAILPDEDLHRHAAENLAQADALLFGRVTYELMEAGWRQPAPAGTRPTWMEPFARTINAAPK